MIVCAPDMTADIAARFGLQPCLIASLSGDNFSPEARKMWRLADVGLAVAKSGAFSLGRYLALIRRVEAHWAVVPDVFGDFRATLANWHRYSPVVARFAGPLFVAQEFHRPRIMDTVFDLVRMHVVERVALPMHQHPDAACASRPRLCAERAERAMRILCGMVQHVHLLGPPLRAVRMLRNALRQCERQGTLVSFDSAAYRRAPNSSIKREMGGRWQPKNGREAAAMLEAWLRQALS